MIRRHALALLTVVPVAPMQGAAAVIALIDDAAGRWSVSAALMRNVARCESQYGQHWRTSHPSNPHRGVYQVSRITWEEQAPRYGLPGNWDAALDPAMNVELAAALFASGQAWRWSACL